MWLGLIRLVALPALFLLLPTADSIMMVGVYAVLLSALGSAGYAPILIFLNERFPTSIRATGTGLSWNIGFAIGGMMPTAVSLVAKDAEPVADDASDLRRRDQRDLPRRRIRRARDARQARKRFRAQSHLSHWA